MKLAALVLAFVLFACGSKCPTCPTLPARPQSSAPIAVVAPRLPCSLPPRPAKFEVVGMASSEGILVTKSDLRGLTLWLADMNAWAASAALCLESR